MAGFYLFKDADALLRAVPAGFHGYIPSGRICDSIFNNKEISFVGDDHGIFSLKSRARISLFQE